MSSGVREVELRATWEAAAPGWAKWEQRFSAGLDDVTDALLDMAGVGTGMRVIDLACGAGSQSLRAARSEWVMAATTERQGSAAFSRIIRRIPSSSIGRSVRFFTTATRRLC